MINQNESFQQTSSLETFKKLKKTLHYLKNVNSYRNEELNILFNQSIKGFYDCPYKLMPTQKLINIFEIEDKEVKKFDDLSYKFKNKNLRLSLKLIKRLVIFITKNSKTSNKNNYLAKNLLKEVIYEMPLSFRKNFSSIFELENITNEILISFLFEIGDYSVIKKYLKNYNFEELTKVFSYFLKAELKNEDYFIHFDEIFESLIKKWLFYAEENTEESIKNNNFSLLNVII